jgi:hypothetical protein
VTVCCPKCDAVYPDASLLAHHVCPPQEYPLWCIDRGTDYAEAQYLGPFDTPEEAQARCDGADEEDDVTEWNIRRCRRATFIDVGLGSEVDYLCERLEERASENPPDGGWADWEDELVEHVSRDAEVALRDWAAANLKLRIFICEPGPA